MLIGTGIFPYVHHIGCAFNIHSIIHNGLIPGAQDLSRRQSVFFLPTDPRGENRKDPEHIDFSVPRRARYLHSACKKHKDAVFLVDDNLAIRKGLTFNQTPSNAIILQGTLPAYRIPEVVRLKTGEVFLRKHTCDLDVRQRSHYNTIGPKKFGSKVARQPREKVARQQRGEASRKATFSQPTQPIQKPICDRSGQPDNEHEVFVDKGETSWSREIKENSSHEELCSSDRSGQPEITPSVIRAQTNLSGEIRFEQTHDRSGQSDKHNVALQDAPEVHREDYDAQHRQ